MASEAAIAHLRRECDRLVAKTSAQLELSRLKVTRRSWVRAARRTDNPAAAALWRDLARSIRREMRPVRRAARRGAGA